MCAIIKNPLQRDGTNQQERLASVLLPENAKIDDRQIEEIIAFASGYAKLISYYNTSNVVDGDWSCFYDNDPCVILALLATIDVDSLEAELNKILEKIDKNLAGEYCGPDEPNPEEDLPHYYDELINLIYSIALQIHQSCEKLPQGHALKSEIIAIIQTDLHLAVIDNKQQDALIKLIGYDKASIKPINNYAYFIANSSVCSKAWQLDQEGFDCIFPDNSFNSDNLKSLFFIFLIALIQIKNKARNYFEECIELNDSHQPHITLFLTFLFLFRNALDHLNSLTEAHLIHYYEKVLCLSRRKENPDQVHLVFELAKNFETYLIDEGILFNAGKDVSGKLRAFKLLEELVVNKAKVAEIKTVYIDERVLREEDPHHPGVFWDKRVSIVLAAPIANTKDGLGEEFSKDEIEHWRPMGKKENSKYELGFGLASPMLMLSEGVRDIWMSFDLEVPPDFGKEVSPFLYSSIFRLEYSNGDRWVELDDVSYKLMELVKYDLDTYNLCFDVVSAGAVPNSSPNPMTRDDIKKMIRAKKIKFASSKVFAAGEEDDFEKEAEGAEKTFYYKIDLVQKKLIFLIHINEFADPILAVDTEKNSNPISTPWPVFKFYIRNDPVGGHSAFTVFKDVLLKRVDIRTDIKGVKQLTVQNDTATLNPSRDFFPFGIRPIVGSSFYIGSNEVFQKKLDRLDIYLQWANLPLDIEKKEGLDEFATYYSNYTLPSTATPGNGFFTVSISYLFNRVYQPPLLTGTKLFTDGEALPTDQVRKITADNLSQFNRFPNLDGEIPEYKVDTQRGFIRLKLEKSFFSAEYPPSLAAQTINGSVNGNLDATTLPKEPFTPVLKNVNLSYASSQAFDINMPIQDGVDSNSTYENLYHITPFGYKKIIINNTPQAQQPVVLFPQFHLAQMPSATSTDTDPGFTQGNLYLGLKDAKPEQKVNILFQVLEGSGDNNFSPPDVEWDYLINNEWVPFKPFEIEDHTRADETSRKSLLRSGIIEFTLPKTITSAGTTILDGQYLWIRACAHQQSLPLIPDSNLYQSIQRIDALPDLVAVMAQAGLAEFENDKNSLEHLALPLPAKTISKFVDSQAAIKSVSQPYNSFGGRLPESNYQFFTRGSERLRHKNRAICIWDYERLILEQFPALHKVKCLNHTSILENKEFAPGFVTIAVIPDLRNRNTANLLEPRVPIGVLDEIKAFTLQRTNLFVASPFSSTLDYLQVVNPLYEQIKVKCCVRFYTGLDPAYYKYLLNDDLKKFLSPWAFDTNSEINFGSTVHKSAILNFIEEREYVDVVLGFKIEHYKDGLPKPDYDPDWIIPTTSRSILTSYNLIDIGKEYEHEIEVLPYDEDDPCPSCTATSAAMKLLAP